MFSLNSLLMAFLLGGVVCLLGQLVMDLTPPFITPGHVMVGYVTMGAVISAFGWYQPLIDLGGAGATIPLSGFGHNLAQGAIEGAKQAGVIGAFGGGAQATSAGIVAALVFGYTTAVLFNPKG